MRLTNILAAPTEDRPSRVHCAGVKTARTHLCRDSCNALCHRWTERTRESTNGCGDVVSARENDDQRREAPGKRCELQNPPPMRALNSLAEQVFASRMWLTHRRRRTLWPAPQQSH